MLSCTRISEEDYVKAIKEEIKKVVDIQEDLDIDVLVHGEPEVSRLTLNQLIMTRSVSYSVFNNTVEKRHG